MHSKYKKFEISDFHKKEEWDAFPMAILTEFRMGRGDSMILTFHVAHYLEGRDYVISIVCNPKKFRKIEKMRNHDTTKLDR